MLTDEQTSIITVLDEDTAHETPCDFNLRVGIGDYSKPCPNPARLRAIGLCKVCHKNGTWNLCLKSAARLENGEVRCKSCSDDSISLVLIAVENL